MLPHVWHPSQPVSEPPSPRTSIYEYNNTTTSEYEPKALGLSSHCYNMPEDTPWPSRKSCGDRQTAKVISSTTSDNLDLKSEHQSQEIPERCAGPWRTTTDEEHQPVLRNAKIEESYSVPNLEERPPSENDEVDMSQSDLEDIAEDESLPGTALERRAQRRKMKRFRYNIIPTTDRSNKTEALQANPQPNTLSYG